MMNFNPQRLTLANGYKNAVRGFINTQELFGQIIKNLSDLKDPSGYLQSVVDGMRETTKQISTVLNVSSNKQLIDGLLFQLNDQIAKDWLQSGGSKGKTKYYGLSKLVEDGYISEAYLSAITSQIGNNVKRIYGSLEEGRVSKGKIGDVIRNADWKGLAGGALSTAANLTPFGSVINNVGGFIYKNWEKQNRNSFNSSAPRFQENVSSFYRGQPQDNFNTGGFNPVGTGGTTNGGGGFAGGVQSGVNYDPQSSRFRGAGGRYVSATTGSAELNKDPLFTFFNKNAYAAGWTRDVLKILKDLNGGVGGGSGEGIGGRIKDLAEEMLGFNLLESGWDKIKGLFGGKGSGGLGNSGQGVTKASPKGAPFNFGKAVTGGIADTAIGVSAIGLTALMSGALIKAWSEEASSFSKLADANDAAGFQNFLKVNNINREKRGLPPTFNPHAALVPLLAELLAETKVGNQSKKDSIGSNAGTNTQRRIYDDIGDTTTQLLNVGVVGNPRK